MNKTRIIKLASIALVAAVGITLFSKVGATDVIVVTEDSELVDVLAKAYRAGVNNVVIKYKVPGGDYMVNLKNQQIKAMKQAGAYFDMDLTCYRSSISGMGNQYHFTLACENDSTEMSYVSDYSKKLAEELYSKTSDKGELVRLVYDKIKSEYNIRYDGDYRPSVYNHIKNKSISFSYAPFVVSKILSEFDIDTKLIFGNEGNSTRRWLMIEINNNWYHLDIAADMLDNQENYFLKSDNYMISRGYVWDITSNQRASKDFLITEKEQATLSVDVYEEKLETVILDENPLVEKPSENPTSGASDWAVNEVSSAIKNDLVPLELQQNYKTNITRKEFASLVMTLYDKLNGKRIVIEPGVFSDTNDADILKAYAAGIVNGVGNGRFAPDNLITREQISVMFDNLLKALNINPEVENEYLVFSDEAEISSWAKEAVQTLCKLNIMNGVGNNRINPKGNATIEQAIILSQKLYEQFK